MRIISLTALLFCLPAMTLAATLHVPAQHATIQEAIDCAQPGDTVLVYEGIYFENIDFKGKAIVVRSNSGPAVTIIDGGQPVDPQIACVMRFINNEDENAVLDGFTVTNGNGYFIEGVGTLGGGVLCYQSNPTIINNIITANVATADGGGIYCNESDSLIEGNSIYDNISAMHGGGIASMNGSAPSIVNNTIYQNHAGTIHGKGWGGGVACKSAFPHIRQNTIFDNFALIGGGGIWCKKTMPEIESNLIHSNMAELRGGGIHIINECHQVSITNNLIWLNKSETGGGVNYSGSTYKLFANNTIFMNEALHRGGGILCDDASTLSVVNTILWENQAPSGPELWTGGESTCSLHYSDCMGGEASIRVASGSFTYGAGMIDADPLFADPGNNDFHLTHPSPCRESGWHNPLEPLPPVDFENDPRVAGGLADMGADEFHTHLYFEMESVPGGSAMGFFVGAPQTAPVLLFIGTGILNAPVNTAFGLFHLAPPLVFTESLGTIPLGGILETTTRIPITFPAPLEIPLQALLGNELTNLFVLKIEER